MAAKQWPAALSSNMLRYPFLATHACQILYTDVRSQVYGGGRAAWAAGHCFADRPYNMEARGHGRGPGLSDPVACGMCMSRRIVSRRTSVVRAACILLVAMHRLLLSPIDLTPQYLGHVTSALKTSLASACSSSKSSMVNARSRLVGCCRSSLSERIALWNAWLRFWKSPIEPHHQGLAAIPHRSSLSPSGWPSILPFL